LERGVKKARFSPFIMKKFLGTQKSEVCMSKKKKVYDGSCLKLGFTKEQVRQKLQELRDYYDDEIVSRVERTILEQMRRYGYLF
jgi:hypothetical protein